MQRRRPQKGWCCSEVVYYDDHHDVTNAGLAIMIASNQSARKMAQAYDVELIQQYRNLLGINPGWFRICH